MELLVEAKEKFSRKDPEFAINDIGVRAEAVRAANDEPGDLVFQYCDEQRGNGFWTLDIGDETFIVKHLRMGRQHRAWVGPEDRYEEDPIACQSNSLSRMITKKISRVGAGRGDSSTVAR